SDINLPGWSEQSIWGYDPLLQCYWARLWRDEDHTDRPRIWISSNHLIPTLDLLVRLVAQAVDHPIDEVYLAMTT
ncbi:MAG TPA: hypothetical protein VFE45_11280, partial [Coriobacteriia bacterium]|nr:hypothetical protein [Coriobacteriia bacterium]